MLSAAAETKPSRLVSLLIHSSTLTGPQGFLGLCQGLIGVFLPASVCRCFESLRERDNPCAGGAAVFVRSRRNGCSCCCECAVSFGVRNQPRSATAGLASAVPALDSVRRHWLACLPERICATLRSRRQPGRVIVRVAQRRAPFAVRLLQFALPSRAVPCAKPTRYVRLGAGECRPFSTP